MDNTVAMILAGGRVGELSVLTQGRAKAAVPFGGAYRIIDFPLSNLMHSGISRVGLLSQYRPSSLIDHVGVGQSWDLAGRNRGVRILPPYKGMNDTDWYKGTADALYQNIDFIEAHEPEVLLILSGDHIYHMDYRPMIKAHLQSGAGMTIGLKAMPVEQASRFGVARLDGDGVVTDYWEKPSQPQSNLASLTIYVVNRRLLVDELHHNAKVGSTHHIYDEIIPRLVERRQVRGHVFDGYWAYARSISDYYRANRDLLGARPLVNLDRWKVRTNMDQDTPPVVSQQVRGLSYGEARQGDLPPARFNGGRVVDSLLSEGVVVAGEVEGSVLSPDVQVAPGAVVRNCVLMHRVQVQEGAVLDGVIADKDVVFGPQCHVGVGELPGRPNRGEPGLLDCGLVVVGKGASLPEGCQVGRNTIIHPELSREDFPGDGEVGAGTTLGGGSPGGAARAEGSMPGGGIKSEMKGCAHE